MLLALRRAQAYFTAMVGHNPARTYEAVAIELQSMRAAGSDHVLLSWNGSSMTPCQKRRRFAPGIRWRAWQSCAGPCDMCLVNATSSQGKAGVTYEIISKSTKIGNKVQAALDVILVNRACRKAKYTRQNFLNI